MKFYFEKTNAQNIVVITDGVTAKIFDGTPTGYLDNCINLYANDAVEQLHDYFAANTDASFDEMIADREMAYEEIEPELADAELIFEI